MPGAPPDTASRPTVTTSRRDGTRERSKPAIRVASSNVMSSTACCVAQDAHLPVRVFLEPVEPKRRVDRYRHPACEQDAEEAREEGLLGAQHE